MESGGWLRGPLDATPMIPVEYSGRHDWNRVGCLLYADYDV